MKRFFEVLKDDVLEKTLKELQEKRNILDKVVQQHNLKEISIILLEIHALEWNKPRDLTADQQHPKGPLGIVIDTIDKLINQLTVNKNRITDPERWFPIQKLMQIISRYDWDFCYAEQDISNLASKDPKVINPTVSRLDSEIEQIKNALALFEIIYLEALPPLRSVGARLEEIDSLHRLDQIEKFFRDFSKSAADINIISIGCRGVSEQQVLPWVFKAAHQFPHLRFTINLFDKFRNGSLEFADTEPHIPEAFRATETEESLWERNGKVYRHKSLQNVVAVVRNFYYPIFEYHKHMAPQIYQLTLSLTKRLLAQNKTVIFSSFTGGSIDRLFIDVFNNIQEDTRLARSLFLLEGSRITFVYHQNKMITAEARQVEDEIDEFRAHYHWPNPRKYPMAFFLERYQAKSSFAVTSLQDMCLDISLTLQHLDRYTPSQQIRLWKIERALATGPAIVTESGIKASYQLSFSIQAKDLKIKRGKAEITRQEEPESKQPHRLQSKKTLRAHL